MQRRDQLAARAAAALDAEWWREATNSELDSVIAERSDEAVATVFARVKRRRRLGLPPGVDCTARRTALNGVPWTASDERAPDCLCLTEALAAAPEKASKADVLALSSKRHRAWTRKCPRRRKPRIVKAEPERVPEETSSYAEPVAEAPVAPAPVTDMSTRPGRTRWSAEPVHPLSWHAFKHGPEVSTRGLLHKQF